MLLVGGGASTVVLTDANGFVSAFQGPDGVNEGLWVDLGSGRFYLRTTDSLSYTYALRPVTPADGLRAWGHSYVSGVMAGSVEPNKAFAPTSAELLGLDLRNNAIGGTSLYKVAAGNSAWPSILQNVTRPQGRFSGPSGVFLSMYGISDISTLGNTYAALDPFMQAQRACISRWRAGAIFEDTHASVTYGGAGTFTAFADPANCSGASYRYNPAAGGTVTITTPADFPGGTMVLGFFGRASNGAVWTSSTINGNVYTVDTRNARTDSGLHYVLRIPNVPAGSAAYVFTTSSVVGATWGAIFDYWQWEPTEDQCPLVVLVKQPHLVDYTAYPTTPPTDAGVDALNQVFDALVVEFGSRVITVDTSSINADATCFISGNAHPTAKGHRIIAGLIRDAVNAVIRVQQRRPVVGNKVEYGTAAPTSTALTYAGGDQVINTAPAAGSPQGWECTTAGNPGTWQAMASLVAKTGTAVLVAGTVTIADAAITANSIIRLSSKTLGGTPGALFVSAKTAATNFVVTSTNAADTSTVQYDIVAY
jgi:hypothetical protein